MENLKEMHVILTTPPTYVVNQEDVQIQIIGILVQVIIGQLQVI